MKAESKLAAPTRKDYRTLNNSKTDNVVKNLNR
jgi:hypothetical protein